LVKANNRPLFFIAGARFSIHNYSQLLARFASL
jgi:hypothetical protein